MVLVAIDPPIEWPTIITERSLYYPQIYLISSIESLIKVSSLISVSFSQKCSPCPLKSKATTVEVIFNYLAKAANDIAE